MEHAFFSSVSLILESVAEVLRTVCRLWLFLFWPARLGTPEVVDFCISDEKLCFCFCLDLVTGRAID